jgi:hypothetical protein
LVIIVSGRYEPVPTIETLFIKYPLSVKQYLNFHLIEQKRARYVKGNMERTGLAGKTGKEVKEEKLEVKSNGKENKKVSSQG